MKGFIIRNKLDSYLTYNDQKNKHKSEDFKLSAANYYLDVCLNYIKNCKIF